MIYKIKIENSLGFLEVCLLQIKKEYNVYEDDALAKIDGYYGIEITNLYEFEELIVLLNSIIHTNNLCYEIILKVDGKDGQMYILLA